ncbi:MAG: carbohydrate porin [Deltaproteobacteria bacterium]|nr:carbohydrate porin [Deltaproteobacteria bacterium]
MAIVLLSGIASAGEVPASDESGFTFGSYGRVQPATDLEGGTARQYNLVSHGSRLDQPMYAEIEFAYRFPRPGGGPRFTMVTTLAYDGELFHYTGVWNAQSAIRNLFLQADEVIWKPLTFWAGSRMYRGDDIYLLDFWPLDNLNTYGGGAGLFFEDTHVEVHAGANRLDTDFQRQEIDVPARIYGAEKVVWMDRQRLVLSARATHFFLRDESAGFGMKAKLHTEYHHLASGSRLGIRGINDVTPDFKEYPADDGFLAGAQFGVWGFGRNSFANVFARYAIGLAAYDPLMVPYGLDNELKTARAREFLLGLSANYEIWLTGTMLGLYARRFNDADGSAYDNDDAWEFIVAMRPHLVIHKHFYLAFELSHQLSKTAGLSPVSNRNLDPAVTKLSVMPLVTVGGGTYARPQLRLVYTASFVNDDAREMINAEDTRSQRSVQHFLGLGAEWWFNSSSYK